MDKLLFTSRDELLRLTHIREGEIKLGQKVGTVANWEELKNHPAKFVLLGIPEDVGVRANGGQPGAAGNWQPVLQAICNVQSTAKLSGEELLVLGTVNVSEEQFNSLRASDIALRALVSRIDEKVYEVMLEVFKAGKTPIVIGGGHNNAYPLLKALSKSKNVAVNALNMDAHADFRMLEGRHSGNGFSYAFEEGYLHKYAVWGLHENYNSQYLIDQLNAHPDRITTTFFEDFLTWKTDPGSAFDQAMQFVQGIYGLELDMDCLAYAAASAATPSGFTPEVIRSMLYQTRAFQPAYFHICEGNAESQALQAKLIAYFISDFVKVQY
jgi:formiminoglutamase